MQKEYPGAFVDGSFCPSHKGLLPAHCTFCRASRLDVPVLCHFSGINPKKKLREDISDELRSGRLTLPWLIPRRVLSNILAHLEEVK